MPCSQMFVVSVFYIEGFVTEQISVCSVKTQVGIKSWYIKVRYYFDVHFVNNSFNVQASQICTVCVFSRMVINLKFFYSFCFTAFNFN
jgi:hypothetical protein